MNVLRTMALPESLAHIDLQAFAKEVTALKDEVEATVGRQDLEHLERTDLIGRLCALVGLLTAWIFPNPVSAWLLSQANFNRWIIAHHVRHGAYDRIEGVPYRLTREGFGKGWRRYVDWLDWISPDGWEYEHNKLHHYHLGQSRDPDLVERNLEFLRRSKLPAVARYAVMAVFAAVWKFTYYASSTTLHLRAARFRQQGRPLADEPLGFFDWIRLYLPVNAAALEFWAISVLPYGLVRFVLLPALFVPLGEQAAMSVFWNLVIAEVLTNVYSFIIIAPNHSGEDIYRFEEGPKSKAEFYLHQVAGSVNYTGGAYWKDFMQGWLNYQIEHHLWPDLPLFACARAQPKLEAICRKYGAPYAKENVFVRFKRMLDIAVGRRSMHRAEAETAVQLAPAA